MSTLYLAHCDREARSLLSRRGPLNPLVRLQAVLTFNALFYDRLVVVDSGALLQNPVLRRLLTGVGPSELHHLLETGVLVPALRDTVDDFVALEHFLRSTGTFNTPDPAVAIPYAKYLDRKCASAVRYSQDDVYARFTTLAESSLSNEELMREVGLRDISADLLTHLISRRDAFGGHFRRSFFFEFAERNARPRHSVRYRQIIEFGGALYHASYAEVLQLMPAFPRDFVRSISALYGAALADFRRAAIWQPEKAASELLPFPVAAFASLPWEAIRDIRSSEAFGRFRSDQVRASATPNAENGGTILYDALCRYLIELVEPLEAAVTGRYKQRKRVRSMARVTKYVSTTGAATITLAGVAFPQISIPLVGVSAAWALLGWSVSKRLEASASALRTASKVELADEALSRSATIVQRSGIARILH